MFVGIVVDIVVGIVVVGSCSVVVWVVVGDSGYSFCLCSLDCLNCCLC